MPELKSLFRLDLSRSLAVLTVLTAALGAGCGKSTPAAPAVAVTADTWAVVDGKGINRDDVDKAYRRTRDAAQTAALSEEETLTAKLALLNDMIVQELLMNKAATLKLEITPAELDTAYGNAKKNISDEAFSQELTRRNLTPADMREGLRRELLTQKVIAQEVGSKITITDQEITDWFNANKAQFNIPEEAYHLAQIAVTPVRDPQITNGTGDDATTPQAATAKVQMLMERLKEGASFAELAAGYSEDPESAPRGGDLGFIPVSRLRQAPPQLRDAVLNKEPGNVNVAATGGAYTLVLVVAHEQAGQRDLSTPNVKQGISDNLKSRKEQLLRAAYLTSIRNDASVVNYLARRLVESNGKAPGVALAAPGK